MTRSGDAASHVERALVLRTFEAFRALGTEDLAVLAEHARPRLFRRGTLLYRPGTVLHCVHFITQGLVAIEMNGETVRTLGPQTVVGGLASLSGEPEARLYRAREHTTTLELDREDMEEVFDEHFPIFVGVVRAIARALVELRQQLGPTAGFPDVKSVSSIGNQGELGLVDKIFVLRRTWNFSRARVEALADLAQETEEVRHPAGTVLWKVDDPADHALMVISGVVRCQAPHGQHFAFDPGSTVGGIDSLGALPRWYEARAETELRALRVSVEQLLDVFEDNIEMGVELLRVLAMGLRGLQELAEAAGASSIAEAADSAIAPVAT